MVVLFVAVCPSRLPSVRVDVRVRMDVRVRVRVDVRVRVRVDVRACVCAVTHIVCALLANSLLVVAVLLCVAPGVPSIAVYRVRSDS